MIYHHTQRPNKYLQNEGNSKGEGTHKAVLEEVPVFRGLGWGLALGTQGLGLGRTCQGQVLFTFSKFTRTWKGFWQASAPVNRPANMLSSRIRGIWATGKWKQENSHTFISIINFSSYWFLDESCCYCCCCFSSTIEITGLEETQQKHLSHSI